MATKFVFNPLTGQFDEVEYIPELGSDPASPAPQSAWVLRTAHTSGGGGGGTPVGLLLALTTAGSPITTYTYQLSYQTTEGTTIRTALS